MIEIRRILCPIDFSSTSEVATTWATDLAHRFEAELHLLYVMASLEPIVPDSEMAIYPGAELVRELHESARKRLDQLEADSEAVKVLREGAPFVEIVQYAGRRTST